MPLILVCDDDRVIGMYLEGLLSENGYAVEVVRSVEMGRESMTKSLPDCLILDLHFPGDATGKEICQGIHRDFPTVPILVVTGTLDHAEDPIEWGADDVIPKQQLSAWHFVNCVSACIRRAKYRQMKNGFAAIERLCDNLIQANGVVR